MNNLKCPYCEKKISYLSAIGERANGEHFCDKCKKNSTIYFVKSIKVFIVVICFIALVLLSAFVFTPLRGNFFCIFIMFIPFIAFYFCIPLFIRFVPIRYRKKIKKPENEPPVGNFVENASGTTKVLNSSEITNKFSKINASPDYTKIIDEVKKKRHDDRNNESDNMIDISKL